MMNYLDFVYTSDGKFGLVLSFDKEQHKYKVVFNFGKRTENTDFYYIEDLKPVI
jgi:hypothetical protein